jgi:hypothetical protein
MSDTAALDQKMEELNNTTNTEEPSYASKVVTFVLQTLVFCIMIIFYYGLSGALLYSCKLAQSNILPTDSKCEPYTEYKPTIQEKQTNIFTDTFISPQNSMKLSFPHDNFNLSNKLLDMFRDYKNEPESNFLANYFISILEALIQFFYICINFTLNMMNQLPEALIVVFGIPIVSIISTIVLIISNFYILFLWFANMKWFFKSNENNKRGPPKWEDVPLISFNFFIACCLVITFFIIFFFGLGFFPFITSFLSLYCGISCLSYKSILNGNNAGVFTIIQDVFKYYKVTIMFVFSVIVVSCAFAKLGPLPGVFSLITLGLIYFGLLGLSIYKPINKDHLSPITDYEQATKTCKPPYTDKDRTWFEFVGLKGGGKNITKQLKDIHKKFTKSNSNM